MQFIYQRKNAKRQRKSGVDMWVYASNKHPNGDVLYQEVDGMHEDEFKSTGTYEYYILEGNGVYVIEGKEYPVSASDVVIIPPNTPFYYKGRMKQILVSFPKWFEGRDTIIRKARP